MANPREDDDTIGTSRLAALRSIVVGQSVFPEHIRMGSEFKRRVSGLGASCRSVEVASSSVSQLEVASGASPRESTGSGAPI